MRPWQRLAISDNWNHLMRLRDMKYIGFKHQRENKQNSDKKPYCTLVPRNFIHWFCTRVQYYTIIVFCWGQCKFLWTLKTIFTEAFRLRWILISKVHKNLYWPIQDSNCFITLKWKVKVKPSLRDFCKSPFDFCKPIACVRHNDYLFFFFFFLPYWRPGLNHQV